MSLKALTEAVSEYSAPFIYAVLAVSGMAGGCFVAAYATLHGKKMTGWFVLAYLTIGSISAVGTGLVLKLMMGAQLDIERAMLAGGMVGFINALAVAGINYSASFHLPRSDKHVRLIVESDKDETTKKDE